MRRIENEPAVILAYETISKSRRVNMKDLYQLAMQINNCGIEVPVTPSDVEGMLIRFIKEPSLYEACLRSARSSGTTEKN
jgi:hypothetical protein